MAGPGRGTKFDDDRARRILADLAAGLTRDCASERNGITGRTLRRWLAAGRKGGKSKQAVALMSFLSGVKKAERDAEARNIAIVQKAAQGGQVVERKTVTRTKRDGTTETEVTEKYSRGEWTAAAWWSERKFPESWGKDTEILREIIAEHRRRKKADG